MPLPFSAAGLIEKNKLSNDKPWILLLEVQLNAEHTIYLARNNEDIPWPAAAATLPTTPAAGGHTYTAFPIQFSDQTQDMKQIPTLSIQVSNVNRLMQSYLEMYKGLTDKKVVIRLVHAGHLDEATAEMEEEFEIQKTQYNDSWVTFVLGSNFWMFYRALSQRYLRDYCQFKYGKIECGVSAACLATYPTCNHTLAHCRIRMAASGITKNRFGGCPGMGGFFAANK